MLAVLLGHLGYSSNETANLLHTHKEQELPEIRTSVRHMLQTLGTEYGRHCIHPDLWVKAAQPKILSFLERGIDVVVDDVRFLNEAALIRKLGGEVWCVERPSAVRTTSHASEGSLDGFHFDRRIVNDSSLFELYGEVKRRVDLLYSLAA